MRPCVAVNTGILTVRLSDRLTVILSRIDHHSVHQINFNYTQEIDIFIFNISFLLFQTLLPSLLVRIKSDNN